MLRRKEYSELEKKEKAAGFSKCWSSQLLVPNFGPASISQMLVENFGLASIPQILFGLMSIPPNIELTLISQKFSTRSSLFCRHPRDPGVRPRPRRQGRPQRPGDLLHRVAAQQVHHRPQLGVALHQRGE